MAEKTTKPTLKGKRRRDWKTPFLAALSECGSVKTACRLGKVDRSHAYSVREKDPEFAKAWDIAREEGGETLEDEALRRAVAGTDRPVFHQGVQVGVIREYSDSLLAILLKANNPSKYREPRGDINVTVESERLAANPEAAKAALAAAAKFEPK